MPNISKNVGFVALVSLADDDDRHSSDLQRDRRAEVEAAPRQLSAAADTFTGMQPQHPGGHVETVPNKWWFRPGLNRAWNVWAGTGHIGVRHQFRIGDDTEDRTAHVLFVERFQNKRRVAAAAAAQGCRLRQQAAPERATHRRLLLSRD